MVAAGVRLANIETAVALRRSAPPSDGSLLKEQDGQHPLKKFVPDKSPMYRSNRFRENARLLQALPLRQALFAARLLPEDRNPSDQSGDEAERMPADLRKWIVGATGIEPVTSAV